MTSAQHVQRLSPTSSTGQRRSAPWVVVVILVVIHVYGSVNLSIQLIR